MHHSYHSSMICPSPKSAPTIAPSVGASSCFAYALAHTENEPLLFKGNDFAQTDIPAAV